MNYEKNNKKNNKKVTNTSSNNANYMKKSTETISDDTKSNATGVESTTTSEIATGIVENCKQLNIRKAPVVESNNVIGLIDEHDEVTIDDTKSNADWYFITTASGVSGYCMKKYIKHEG